MQVANWGGCRFEGDTGDPTVLYLVCNTAIDNSYVFPIETTTINVIAMNAAGNKSSEAFTVTVQNCSTAIPTIKGIVGKILTKVAHFAIANKVATAHDFSESNNQGTGLRVCK